MKSAYIISGAAILLIAAYLWSRDKAAFKNGVEAKEPASPENEGTKKKADQTTKAVKAVNRSDVPVAISQPPTPDSKFTPVKETRLKMPVMVSEPSSPDAGSGSAGSVDRNPDLNLTLIRSDLRRI